MSKFPDLADRRGRIGLDLKVNSVAYVISVFTQRTATVHYVPMLAKVITHAPTCALAILLLSQALQSFAIRA